MTNSNDLISNITNYTIKSTYACVYDMLIMHKLGLDVTHP